MLRRTLRKCVRDTVIVGQSPRRLIVVFVVRVCVMTGGLRASGILESKRVYPYRTIFFILRFGFRRRVV